MVIRTATLAMLRGDNAPQLANAPGRVVKPMGEIEPVKTYKPRKHPEPTSLEEHKVISRAEAKRTKMREYYRKNREQMLAKQKAQKASKAKRT